MKLKNLFTVLLVIFMLLTTSVSAYSTETYSVDINEDEYEMTSEDGITLFQKLSGDNIVIQEIEQKTFGGKLTQYQLNAISQEIASQYQEQFEATVTETAREEVTINNYTVTKMVFETDVSGYIIKQEMNIFVSSDKIYDIIFTSVSEDGFSDEEKNAILNSFKILGEETSSNPLDSLISGDTDSTELTANPEMNAVWIQLGVVIVIAVILMIFAIKRNPKSKLYILAIIFILLQGIAIKGSEMQGMVADDITSDVSFNIGFFVFAIIGIILLIVQLCKKPKVEVAETKKEEPAIVEEPKQTETDNPIKEDNNEDK